MVSGAAAQSLGTFPCFSGKLFAGTPDVDKPDLRLFLQLSGTAAWYSTVSLLLDASFYILLPHNLTFWCRVLLPHMPLKGRGRQGGECVSQQAHAPGGMWAFLSLPVSVLLCHLPRWNCYRWVGLLSSFLGGKWWCGSSVSHDLVGRDALEAVFSCLCTLKSLWGILGKLNIVTLWVFWNLELFALNTCGLHQILWG